MAKNVFRIGGFWADYPGVGAVRDTDVARHVIKHIRFIDRFNVRKIVLAALASQDILFGVIPKDELPKSKNWKYKEIRKK